MADNIYVYHTSPNQKSIVTKKTLSDAEHKYGKCNIDATLTAATELTDRAFKLYVRMNLHKDGFPYALSPVAIMAEIGMSDKRYRDAVKELIDKGYLVQHEKHKSLYIFYEFPQLDDEQYGQHHKSSDNPAKMDTSSAQSGQITRQFQADNPSISGGEIEHNITSHTTRNIIDNNSMFIIQREQERKRRETLDSQMPTYYDADDAIMFEAPEIRDISDTDLDEFDLPF